ncbi:MAG: serine hydrolase [Flavisolibacter sp.]
MKCKTLALFLFLSVGCATRKPSLTPAQEVAKNSPALDNSFLLDLMQHYPGYFDTLLQQNNQWKIKIIYTRIDRDQNNHPQFTNYYFNLDPRQYFYPASTVKMPTAVLSLQKLSELNIPGLDKNTTMITDADYPGQTAVYNDPTTADGRPTVAQYIRKIFLVSDNDAFNRLYEFLGQEYINNNLHRMGYDSVQIIHHLNISLSEEQNRRSNPVRFYDTAAHLLYQQPMQRSMLTYFKRNDLLGNGYYSASQLVNQPFDFSKKNRISLVDLHSILESILFPESIPSRQRFHLKPEDYSFLYRYMSMKPAESDYPAYDTIPDAYSKLLFYGGKGSMDPDIRIFNKEGDAYGFLTDVSYFVDFRSKVEFFLSATIACNSDGIFNDDHYDYDTVGYPFLQNLGRVVYQYELTRKRKFIPDLSKFKMEYGK